MRRHPVTVRVLPLLLAALALTGTPGCGSEDECPAVPDDPAPVAKGTEDGDLAEIRSSGERVTVPADPFLARAEEALRAAEGAASRLDALRSKQAARVAYSEAMLAGLTPGDEARIRPRLEALTEEILDAGTPLAGVMFEHQVRGGETLWKLCLPKGVFAKKGAHLEPGFVCWINGIKDASRLRAGQAIQVPVGEFRLVVEKSRYRLLVFYGGCLVKTYRVGLGKKDKTPEGEFVIETKLEDPTWTGPDNVVIPHGDPRNPLGKRWMGFSSTRKARGYGIHGTQEPETIGRDSSNGCIRMHDRDVRELFTWVPRQAKVVIRR